MRRRIQRRPSAVVDITEIALFIAQDRPDAARAFVNAVTASLDTLAEFPHAGVAVEIEGVDAAMRRFTVRGFPNHSIFYLALSDRIDVLRVIHGARDLGPELRRDE